MTKRKAPMRRRPAKPGFAEIDNHRVKGKAFRVRPGVSNFQPRRHRWNLGSLPPLSVSRASGISVQEGSHQCVATVVLNAKHVLGVAVNCMCCIYLCVASALWCLGCFLGKVHVSLITIGECHALPERDEKHESELCGGTAWADAVGIMTPQSGHTHLPQFSLTSKKSSGLSANDRAQATFCSPQSMIPPFRSTPNTGRHVRMHRKMEFGGRVAVCSAVCKKMEIAMPHVIKKKSSFVHRNIFLFPLFFMFHSFWCAFVFYWL